MVIIFMRPLFYSFVIIFKKLAADWLIQCLWKNNENLKIEEFHLKCQILKDLYDLSAKFNAVTPAIEIQNNSMFDIQQK